MTKSSFLKNCCLTTLTISIMFFVLAPHAFANSSSLGEGLTDTLIESKDFSKTWESFSEDEKQAVKLFANEGKVKLEELNKYNLDSDEIESEISSLPEKVQKGIVVSLLPVNEEASPEPANNNINVTFNVSHELTYHGIWDNTVASITHNIVWSATGAIVTGGSRTVLPGNPGLGWSYEGLIRDETDSNAVRYSSDIQAHLSLDVAQFNVQNWYPRSQIVGYADGSYDYTDYN